MNTHKRKTSPTDNYVEKKNKINEKGNNNHNPIKQKIKVIMFNNGFILNNGPFRDKSIPVNMLFMEEVSHGVIPKELVDKGIKNVDIILENRKNEIYYYSPNNINPVSSPSNTYIPTNNINNDPNVITNIKINPPIVLNPGEEIPFQYQKPYINIIKQEPSIKNEFFQEYPVQKYDVNKNRQNKSNMSRTPIGQKRNMKRTVRKKEEKYDEDLKLKKRESVSEPKNKKKSKKIHTFASLIKEEKEKEEQNNGQENNGTKEEKEEEKKFEAFTGTGQFIGNINTEGLRVDKNIKNVVNKDSPICTFSIRLFNGEVIKCQFNYNQTLRDIYYYVNKISGSNNFYLLDGFPPKPLREYNKIIGDLKLDNTILTQKIKEC